MHKQSRSIASSTKPLRTTKRPSPKSKVKPTRVQPKAISPVLKRSIMTRKNHFTQSLTTPRITPACRNKGMKVSPTSVPISRLFSTSVGSPDITSEFYKLDLRVALLDNIRDHINADALYVMDCYVGDFEDGQEIPRQLVSNVKPYMSIEKLTKRQQIVLCNLKPITMRGQKSHAMMIGTTPPSFIQDAQNGLAEPLYTPSNTQVVIEQDSEVPAGTTPFKTGQRLYLAGQGPMVGELARVNDKAITKLFDELGTDIEGNLTYLNHSVVFGPIDSPVKVHIGIPEAKLL